MTHSYAQGSQQSLLHFLCQAETSYDAAKLLLSLGAEPNIQDKYGWSPLHTACFRGHKNLVLLLLSMVRNL